MSSPFDGIYRGVDVTSNKPTEPPRSMKETLEEMIDAFRNQAYQPPAPEAYVVHPDDLKAWIDAGVVEWDEPAERWRIK